MFRHILIPTDGTPLGAKAIRTGVRLAQALDASVTGLFIAYSYASPAYLPAMPRGTLKRLTQRAAENALKPLIAASKQARVRCDTRTVVTGEPWQAILRTARSRGCDAIVMATHGRGALANLVLGSETGQVLAHSKVPVLVVR